ncbi:MAG: LysM peptidoglycan-binding domain-containing protein, partial [Chlamydiales bacterium]|nr:LysM peptidoglycan-binding domain-containing protein [Chlamydiales bacterium]
MDFEMQLSMAGIHPDFAQDKKPSHKAVGVSRKDTIIIAMLVNIALLAVLFATASRQPSIIAPAKVEPIVAQLETVSHVSELAQNIPVVKTKEPVDEIDEILKSYALQNTKNAPVTAKPVQEVVKETQVAPITSNKSSFIEVKVKKGDVLSRIARQHNVKVEEIIVLNGLESAHVKVGQVLKV